MAAYQTYLDRFDALCKAMVGRAEARLWIHGIGAQRESCAHVAQGNHRTGISSRTRFSSEALSAATKGR